MDGREYQAIEQNAEKPSRWGELARKGHQVVQFKHAATNRFLAAVDGKSRCTAELKLVRSDTSPLEAWQLAASNSYKKISAAPPFQQLRSIETG